MTAALGGPDHLLGEQQVSRFIEEQLGRLDLDGRSICLVVPDATRTCPLPMLLAAVKGSLAGRARCWSTVVALGTHAPMDEAVLRRLVGCDDLAVVNHEWWNDDTFAEVGSLDAGLVSRLSGERLRETVSVRINRTVVDSDVTLIIGPVLPHEVAGYSGGNKYLFPGLSGRELIDVTHWLGALITSREIIGKTGTTPVRAIIDTAADMVPGERHAMCVVVDNTSGRLHSVAFGDPREAWEAAAEVAARTHVQYLAEPVRRVLSLVPRRYGDLWTGAKGFYKVEPVVADGGEVVLYAPHITELAATHPRIAELGYHCRDYFLAHWERYRSYPGGELAHSTHLFGAGSYDQVSGEHQRVRVVLATGIPREIVEGANLSYMDPARVRAADWRSDPDGLVVPDAGEVLYRLR